MDPYISPLRPEPARPAWAIGTLILAMVALLVFFVLGLYALPYPQIFQGGR